MKDRVQIRAASIPKLETFYKQNSRQPSQVSIHLLLFFYFFVLFFFLTENFFFSSHYFYILVYSLKSLNRIAFIWIAFSYCSALTAKSSASCRELQGALYGLFVPRGWLHRLHKGSPYPVGAVCGMRGGSADLGWKKYCHQKQQQKQKTLLFLVMMQMHLLSCWFIEKAECTLINIHINAPELAERLYSSVDSGQVLSIPLPKPNSLL